jgi:NADPH-dependent stearoyl-CoA 9-desaturase
MVVKVVARLDLMASHSMPPDEVVHLTQRLSCFGRRVRALCDKYDLPYTTGALLRQYWQSFWTILKLALPDKLLEATADDAPETNSEVKFRVRDGVRESFGIDPATGKRRGLRTAVHQLQSGTIGTA